ncbi:MAG: hypothetical protein ABS33_04930 [Verrucomicrobia subdivision 6 bacterium BACL9 MAG-120924-bin69]|uniref:Uncharacterized protein n=2 Tax=Verrucomicrobia subdivision 6 TaxID=134627 RepID=A0A0R2X8G2_9BACT|nr:MAG: hypothetical protein ABS32_04095 [Verrucomicrobia subdivision 6 bacterium BACL9 MAG-120820-bin42]KRP33283.1 MAG: hypothetical protein ABS33_04930 [Verrucomicrobia subdivision 6 bacterium BACL9 MAG-120924-bin69]
MTEGLEVLVQEVMAAITTDPFRRVEGFGFWISDLGFLDKGSGVGRSEIISCSSADNEIEAVLVRSPEFLPYPPSAVDFASKESKVDLREGSSMRS